MAKIIVVTSGKGGVGKTTTSASIASGLALKGHKTAVIDFDVGLRNLDLIMGCERRVVYDLIKLDFEFVICDSPAGIETGALMALYFADEAIVTTNPEVSSVRDSDRILGILQSKSRHAEKGEQVKEHLLITRYNPDRVASGEMLSVKDIEDVLRIPLLGVIPESQSVLQASNVGLPVIHQEGVPAAEAYKDVVARLLGENRPMRFLEAEKKGFLQRLFGG